MLKRLSNFTAFVLGFVLLLAAGSTMAQSSGTVEGIVTDPSGAAVPNATVEIHNPVSHFDRSTTTDSEGKFRFTSVPFNPYHLSATASGFAQYAQDVDIRSLVTVSVAVTLKVASASTSVTVPSDTGRTDGNMASSRAVRAAGIARHFGSCSPAQEYS